MWCANNMRGTVTQCANNMVHAAMRSMVMQCTNNAVGAATRGMATQCANDAVHAARGAQRHSGCSYERHGNVVGVVTKV
jgi:hypothetical protein